MNADSPVYGRMVAEPAKEVPPCSWVKLTQLFGEVSCYLQAAHDGNHCSVEWMEWT
jgi:hypothetical protein